jgi:hypothetical protein
VTGPKIFAQNNPSRFRLERAVVDRLRLGHFAVRPLQDALGDARLMRIASKSEVS